MTSRGARHAHLEGFDLHANRTVRADDRVGLERLCQYLLRPPLAQGRLERLRDGRVLDTLTHPWSDGTRQLLFRPLELLEKLAVLVPRPRINLLLYHGVLAAHARGRAHTVSTAHPPPGAAPATSGSTPPSAGAPAQAVGALPPVVAEPTTPGAATPAGVDTAPARPPRRYWAWADLLRRIFAIDVLACSQCGGIPPSSRASSATSVSRPSCRISTPRVLHLSPTAPWRSLFQTEGPAAPIAADPGPPRRFRLVAAVCLDRPVATVDTPLFRSARPGDIGSPRRTEGRQRRAERLFIRAVLGVEGRRSEMGCYVNQKAVRTSFCEAAPQVK